MEMLYCFFQEQKKFIDIHQINEGNITLGIDDNIRLKKDDVTKGKYFIAVYSYKVSEYTISVIVER